MIKYLDIKLHMDVSIETSMNYITLNLMEYFMGGGGGFSCPFVHVDRGGGGVECPRLSTRGGGGGPWNVHVDQKPGYFRKHFVPLCTRMGDKKKLN